MAQTASIGNTFTIYITNDAATTFTVAQPNDFSEYKIIKVSVFNSGGTPNFTLADSAGNSICGAQATIAAGWKDMVINAANQVISSTENLVITTAGATTTQMIIYCQGTGLSGNNTGMVNWLSTVDQSLSVA